MKQVLSFLKRFEIVFYWRYWPTLLFYIPVMLYVFLTGIFRARRLFYFAAANPEIPIGGLGSVTKYVSLKKVPATHVPKTILIGREIHSFEKVNQLLQQSGIRFPLIAKPDGGERGFLVKKIHSMQELEDYHRSHDMAYLIQDFIDAPREFSILLHNAGGKFQISSFIEKRYLRLVGDGKSSIRNLLAQKPCTRFKSDAFNRLKNELDIVIPDKTVYVPFQIGNWSYGTEFINRNKDIDDVLIASMARINQQIGLFNYARYDIKCDSLEALRDGRFYVLEINGVNGEPLHIYAGPCSFFGAYATVFRHWEYVYRISNRNKKAGASIPNADKGFRIMYSFFIAEHFASRARQIDGASLQ